MIEKKELAGPFFDADLFKGFERFSENAFLKLGEEAKRRLRRIAGNNEFYFRQLWQDFVNSEAIQRAEFFLPVDYLVMLNFVLYGKKTFFFADNLIEHLAHTELDAPSSHIKLPFPSCQFVITAEKAINAMWRIHGTPPQSTEPISVFVTETKASAEESGERKILFVCYQNLQEDNPFFVKRSLLIREDWSVRQMLQTNWQDILDTAEEKSEQVSFALDDEAFYENQGVLLFYRILLNSILYLQSNDADIISKLSPHRRLATMNHREKRAAFQQFKQEKAVPSELDYNSVGEQVKPLIIQRIVIENDNAAEEVHSGASDSVRKLAKRLLVRGHWRNQPFGTGLSERKLIWIKPYLKGPEMAELVERPFLVK